MTSLAIALQAFFTDRLIQQRNASPNTIAAYRDSFRLLFRYMRETTGKTPSKLDLPDLDAQAVVGFLQHLETSRGSSVRTRNARLTAIHSFFHYAAMLHPEHSALIERVLDIPEKRFETTLVSFLTRPETEALLAAPDRSTWTGRRDHTLLLMAVQTGLRVSELAGLRCQDVELASPGAHVRCHGKGRKDRSTPLTKSAVAVLHIWLGEHDGGPDSPLLPSRGRNSHLTRGAIWRLVAKYAEAARVGCGTLAAKHVTPHVLRHTAAMTLLHGGVDIATIALWLGHYVGDRRSPALRHIMSDHADDLRRMVKRPGYCNGRSPAYQTRRPRIHERLPARRHGPQGTCPGAHLVRHGQADSLPPTG